MEVSLSFFPTVMQPPIQVVGNSVHACLVRAKVCRRPIRKYDVGAPSTIAISLPGMDPHDAERRRKKALLLLSERLNQQQSGGDREEAWPLMEEAPASRTQSPIPSLQPSTHTTLPVKSSKSVTIALPSEPQETLSQPTVPSTSSLSSQVASSTSPALATLVNVGDDTSPTT